MDIIRQDPYYFPHYSFEEIEFHPPQPIEGFRVGIDPGTVNLGIVILAPDHTGLAYQVKMERDKDPMLRMQRVREVLRRIYYGFEDCCCPTVIIEGASFADKFRQSEMAEQRACIGLWFNDHCHAPIRFISPTSIYKKVFGSAKIRAWNQWPELPRDAASALACAYLPLDGNMEAV